MGLEGLVSKHRERAYRSGRRDYWVVKNRRHPACTRAVLGQRGAARSMPERTPQGDDLVAAPLEVATTSAESLFGQAP